VKATHTKSSHAHFAQLNLTPNPQGSAFSSEKSTHFCSHAIKVALSFSAEGVSLTAPRLCNHRPISRHVLLQRQGLVHRFEQWLHGSQTRRVSPSCISSSRTRNPSIQLLAIKLHRYFLAVGASFGLFRCKNCADCAVASRPGADTTRLHKLPRLYICICYRSARRFTVHGRTGAEE
jgi:hypothetical protein